MQDYSKEYNSTGKEFNLGFDITIPGLIIAFGFALIIFSTFLDFTPICQRSWRAGGVGLPVMLFSMLGIIFALRKNYFTAFFIGIFAAFFLTHEIIIIYDNRAVELGQELKPDGWFRSVIQVYQDALRPAYGALWGMIGASLASLFPLIGMVIEVHRKNIETAYFAEREQQRNETFASDDKEISDASSETAETTSN